MRKYLLLFLLAIGGLIVIISISDFISFDKEAYYFDANGTYSFVIKEVEVEIENNKIMVNDSFMVPPCLTKYHDNSLIGEMILFDSVFLDMPNKVITLYRKGVLSFECTINADYY